MVRLVKRGDFLRLAQKGRKAVTSGLVLQVMQTPSDSVKIDDGPTARLGFTVSSKVGNAVVRNRIRRRLKAMVSEVFPYAAMPGFDYVVIGRNAALKRPYDRLVKDLKYALHNTGTFNEDHSRQTV